MRKRVLIVGAVICTVLFFLVAIRETQAEVKPTVYIDPPEKKVTVCSKFNISVSIRNVTDLNYYEIHLSYDKDRLRYINAYPGDFLGGLATFMHLPWLNQIKVVQNHKTTGGGSTGSGTLFKITFHCRKAGTSELTLTVIKLKDKKGGLIDDYGIENGKVIQRDEEGDGGILIPVDRFGLLAPHIGAASVLLVSTVATAIYTKRVRCKKEKR